MARIKPVWPWSNRCLVLHEAFFWCFMFIKKKSMPSKRSQYNRISLAIFAAWWLCSTLNWFFYSFFISFNWLLLHQWKIVRSIMLIILTLMLVLVNNTNLPPAVWVLCGVVAVALIAGFAVCSWCHEQLFSIKVCFCVRKWSIFLLMFCNSVGRWNTFDIWWGWATKSKRASNAAPRSPSSSDHHWTCSSCWRWTEHEVSEASGIQSCCESRLIECRWLV